MRTTDTVAEERMSVVAFQSAKRLAGKIRRRDIGCLELLDHYLARVDLRAATH